jgi:hypothetical protein
LGNLAQPDAVLWPSDKTARLDTFPFGGCLLRPGKVLYEKDSEAEDASIWVLEPHALNALEELGDITPSIDVHMCKKILRPAFMHIASENNKVLSVMVAEPDMRMFVQ